MFHSFFPYLSTEESWQILASIISLLFHRKKKFYSLQKMHNVPTFFPLRFSTTSFRASAASCNCVQPKAIFQFFSFFFWWSFLVFLVQDHFWRRPYSCWREGWPCPTTNTYNKRWFSIFLCAVDLHKNSVKLSNVCSFQADAQQQQSLWKLGGAGSTR